MKTHLLTHNGKEIYRGSENECYFKLQRSQGMSADWAIKHEGWKVEPVRMSIDKKQRNEMIHAYILGCIDGEGYGVTLNTDKDKVAFLLDTFNAEIGKWRTPKIGEQKAFTEWCQGLPSAFNIEFENWKILQLGYKWGLLNKPNQFWDETRKGDASKEEKFINQYWNILYMNVKAIEKKVNKVSKAYVRKTEDEYIILGNYGQGWEEVCTETNYTDLKSNLKAYRENEPGTPFKWIKKRVKIEARIAINLATK